MSLISDPRAVDAIAAAAAQILGAHHTLVHQIADLKRDPSAAPAVYAQIEALPETPRRALAAFVADWVTPAAPGYGEPFH